MATATLHQRILGSAAHNFKLAVDSLDKSDFDKGLELLTLAEASCSTAEMVAGNSGKELDEILAHSRPIISISRVIEAGISYQNGLKEYDSENLKLSPMGRCYLDGAVIEFRTAYSTLSQNSNFFKGKEGRSLRRKWMKILFFELFDSCIKLGVDAEVRGGELIDKFEENSFYVESAFSGLNYWSEAVRRYNEALEVQATARQNRVGIYFKQSSRKVADMLYGEIARMIDKGADISESIGPAAAQKYLFWP